MDYTRQEAQKYYDLFSDFKYLQEQFDIFKKAFLNVFDKETNQLISEVSRIIDQTESNSLVIVCLGHVIKMSWNWIPLDPKKIGNIYGELKFTIINGEKESFLYHVYFDKKGNIYNDITEDPIKEYFIHKLKSGESNIQYFIFDIVKELFSFHQK